MFEIAKTAGGYANTPTTLPLQWSHRDPVAALISAASRRNRGVRAPRPVLRPRPPSSSRFGAAARPRVLARRSFAPSLAARPSDAVARPAAPAGPPVAAPALFADETRGPQRPLARCELAKPPAATPAPATLSSSTTLSVLPAVATHGNSSPPARSFRSPPLAPRPTIRRAHAAPLRHCAYSPTPTASHRRRGGAATRPSRHPSPQRLVPPLRMEQVARNRAPSTPRLLTSLSSLPRSETTESAQTPFDGSGAAI